MFLQNNQEGHECEKTFINIFSVLKVSVKVMFYLVQKLNTFGVRMRVMLSWDHLAGKVLVKRKREMTFRVYSLQYFPGIRNSEIP